MILTERLRRIADEIAPGETMADIGTDHGYLPVYLFRSGISPRVVLADVSRGSLDKARENCRAEARSAAFDLRLGSGLEVLSAGEVDDVVIAGMGGILIAEILAADPEKTRSFRKLILQPRNNTGRLRAYLLSRGFQITREQLVRERKFICEILTAVPDDRSGLPVDGSAGDGNPGARSAMGAGARDADLYGRDPETTAYFDFPDTLAESGEALLEEYLERQLDKYLKITEIIKREGSRTGALPFHEAKIRRIRAILSREEMQ